MSRKKEDQLYQSVIIITGASSGIGKSLAKNLAPYNPRLVLVARRAKLLMRVVTELLEKDIEVLPIVGDVRKAHIREKIVKTTLEKFGRIDILVNNAGLGKLNKFVNQPESEINQMIDTNVTALIKLTRKVLKSMKEHQSGHIINISSILAYVPVFPYAVYCATKAAVKMFGESIKEELKEYNVRVSTIYPGLHNTEFSRVSNIDEKAFKLYDTEKLVKKIMGIMKKPRDRLFVPGFYALIVFVTQRVKLFRTILAQMLGKQMISAKIVPKLKVKQAEKTKKEKAIKVIQ